MINRMHSAHDVDLLHYIHQDLYFIINIVFINQYSVRFSLGKMQREDSFCKSGMMQFCFFFTFGSPHAWNLSLKHRFHSGRF